jgi:hypothetical protein
MLLAACGGRLPPQPPQPQPSPTRTTVAPTVATSAPSAPPPAWVAPVGCHPDPPLTKPLHAAFTALPPLARVPRKPPPISARGAARRGVELPRVDVLYHRSPHDGAVPAVLPDPDPRHDRECGFAEVLPRLGRDARTELEAFLVHGSATPGPGADPERALPHLAGDARAGDTNAAFAMALASLAKPRAPNMAWPTGEEAALRLLAIAKKALPANDAVGARARRARPVLRARPTSRGSRRPGGGAALLGVRRLAPAPRRGRRPGVSPGQRRRGLRRGMSGYTDSAIVHAGVLDPGTELVSKPFTTAELTRKVRKVLDAGRA